MQAEGANLAATCAGSAQLASQVYPHSWDDLEQELHLPALSAHRMTGQIFWGFWEV